MKRYNMLCRQRDDNEKTFSMVLLWENEMEIFTSKSDKIY